MIKMKYEIEKKDIECLLLCSECGNLLRIDIYSKRYGFFKVYPCIHCNTKQTNNIKEEELIGES